MTERPIQVVFDGEALRPTSAFWLKRARDQWGAGEVLTIEAREERSHKSHAHYFAAIQEAWNNLPDDKREQYPTPEHLRAWALIRAGYHTMIDYTCAGPSSARDLL